MASVNKALTLSIIIPAYNEERHLRLCLDSIAAQTDKPTEVVVIDNNSTDKTAQIAKSYPFVRLLHESRQGIQYARNRGFDNAKGDILGRIDADTVLPKNWVRRVNNFYSDGKHTKTALTGGGYFYNMRLPKINGWIQGQMAYRMNRFVIGYYVLWGSNMALPSGLWEAVRRQVCNDRSDIHEDLDLAIHLHDSGYSIHYQENLRVGVYLKRVWNNRSQLRAHMRRWPTTLRVHGYKKWWMGVLGNLLMWYIVQPIFFIAEILARLRGGKSIQ